MPTVGIWIANKLSIQMIQNSWFIECFVIQAMSLNSELIVRYASGIWLPIFFTMVSNQMVQTIQLATIWKPKK